MPEESTGLVWLNDERVAAQVKDSLHFLDRKKYRLNAYCLMSNHVHVGFKLVLLQQNLPENKTASDHSLAKIRQSLKGFTAHQCNQIPGRSGTFWEQKSYDHYIRNQEEADRIISYVLNNPVKAGLVTN